METATTQNGGGILSAKFLGEPAYRWMFFAIAASLFLFVWGRVISLLAEAE